MDASSTRALAIALAAGSYALYIASTLFYFRRGESGFTWPMRALSVLATLTMGMHLYGLTTVESTSSILGTIGCGLLACGPLLHLWALWSAQNAKLGVAFGGVKSEHYVTTGAYRYLNHPIYVSYSLTWIGGALCTGSPWAWWPVLLLLPWYAFAAWQEHASESIETLAVRNRPSGCISP